MRKVNENRPLFASVVDLRPPFTRRRTTFLSLVWRSCLSTFLLSLSIARVDATEQQDLPPKELAIVGVHVVPMGTEQVVENRTVVVRDGRIAAIGNSTETEIPAGAMRVDGKGRYLMPGLADMHVHIRRSDDYINFLNHGVTTVMHLGGSSSQGRTLLADRKKIKSGNLLGPRIYATERILDGDPPAAGGAYRLGSPALAREKVIHLKKNGFDFVKIYNNVSLPVFEAIIDEARKQDMAVLGHLPRGFDPMIAIRQGQDAIVHSEELFFTYFEGPRKTEGMDRSYRADHSKIPDLVEALASNDVAIMPDLSYVFTNFLMWDSLDLIWTDPEMKVLHPATLRDWEVSNINRRQEIENFVVRGQWKYELIQELTRQFQRAGILQLVGTDASLAGLFPGKSVHRELTEMVKAGLSSYEALSIATRNAGEFVRRHIDEGARFGLVELGYRADFIVVDHNPLDDVRNVQNPSAVVVNGRWLERADMEQRRASLATRYDELRFVNEIVDEALGHADAKAAITRVLADYDGIEEIASAVERRINSAGYAALSAGHADRACEILELGTRLFPESANAWDSLAEVFLHRGDRDKAIEYYRKALQVDPDFSNAATQLEEILLGDDE